jgi:hypothetical protein
MQYRMAITPRRELQSDVVAVLHEACYQAWNERIFELARIKI